MTRTRTTIIDVDDRREQLRLAGQVMQELIEGLPVYLDPEYPLQGINRDEKGRPYLEFATEDPERVKSFLREHGHEKHTEVTPWHEPLGDPCVRCGNIAGPTRPTVCPNCGFRDIEPCPICGAEVPRSGYRRLEGSVHVCPHPRNGRYHKVHVAFNEPLITLDGSFTEPLVIVSPLEE